MFLKESNYNLINVTSGKKSPKTNIGVPQGFEYIFKLN